MDRAAVDGFYRYRMMICVYSYHPFAARGKAEVGRPMYPSPITEIVSKLMNSPDVF